MFEDLKKGLSLTFASGKEVKPEGSDFEDNTRHEPRKGDQVGESLLVEVGRKPDAPKPGRYPADLDEK